MLLVVSSVRHAVTVKSTACLVKRATTALIQLVTAHALLPANGARVVGMVLSKRERVRPAMTVTCFQVICVPINVAWPCPARG